MKPMSQSPYWRGDADCYYGRDPKPHKWAGNDSRSADYDLTPEEVAEYWRGYEENPIGKKDWG
jgi:hypothetical protein